MQTERDIASGGWSDPVASAIAWTYDNAPAGLDTLLHLGRRYVAPLLKPRLPMRRIAIGDGMSGTVLAIGESLTLDYVLQRLGGTRAAETLRGGATLFEIGSRLRSGTIEHDVVLVVVPRALAVPLGARCVRVPGLVSFVLPVASSLDTSLAEATTTVRRDARRVMEAGTIWTIATETVEFERFYDLFYTPSVVQRFGELAVLRHRAMLRRQFRHGGALIWLERAGRRIAGTVVQVRGSTLHGLVAAADPSIPHEGRAGPQFAIKIAALDLAPRLGAKRIDLGGTVPSLRDGSFQAKRAFGAELVRMEDSHRDLLLSWRAGAPAIRRLLHRAPLLFDAPGGLCGVAAVEPGDVADVRVACQLWRQYAPAGMRRLVVVGAATYSSHATDGPRRRDGPIVLCPECDASAVVRAASP